MTVRHIVYPKGEVEVELVYKGRASKVIDWIKDEEVGIAGSGEWTKLHLTIPPGHIRIFEFVIGKGGKDVMQEKIERKFDERIVLAATGCFAGYELFDGLDTARADLACSRQRN